ncbi:hypothetical protein OC845_006915, partial [Tilletia horrida]
AREAVTPHWRPAMHASPCSRTPCSSGPSTLSWPIASIVGTASSTAGTTTTTPTGAARTQPCASGGVPGSATGSTRPSTPPATGAAFPSTIAASKPGRRDRTAGCPRRCSLRAGRRSCPAARAASSSAPQRTRPSLSLSLPSSRAATSLTGPANASTLCSPRSTSTALPLLLPLLLLPRRRGPRCPTPGLRPASSASMAGTRRLPGSGSSLPPWASS